MLHFSAGPSESAQRQHFQCQGVCLEWLSFLFFTLQIYPIKIGIISHIKQKKRYAAFSNLLSLQVIHSSLNSLIFTCRSC